jgi:sulfoxide reductase heme-binding subunit YedZ
LKVAVHLISWLPLVWILINFAFNRLTVNPIQDIEQRLGRLSLYFFVASLAITPSFTLTGWRGILAHRRAIGLYAFFYVCLHVLAFIGLDYGFNFKLIFPLLVTKPYLILGILSFSLLLPLAVTSSDFFIRHMKKNWKRLHWLVYPTGFIVIIHYAWSLKGDLFRLRGNIIQPLVWGLVILTLLILRLPLFRRWISSLRRKLFSPH